MNLAITDLMSQIRCMEEELEVQLALARADLHLRIEGERWSSNKPFCNAIGS